MALANCTGKITSMSLLRTWVLTGAAPVNTQVLKREIEVILPESFASAKPVYPRPA